MRIRVIHEQHNKLLSASERQFLSSEQAFKPFIGLNPIQYNPFTVPLWNAAVAQYSKSIEPVEDRVATKLREKLTNTKAKSFQVTKIAIFLTIFVLYILIILNFNVIAHISYNNL